jgi:type II secretory pathway pseudopilin PulG
MVGRPVHDGRCGAGFTLAEALLAVMLLGIASASVLLPFTAGEAARRDGLARTMAANLASEQMEKALRTPFSQMVSTWGSVVESEGTLTDPQGNALSGNMYAFFARTTTCTYVYTSQQSGTLAPSLVNLTIAVSYRGAPMISLTRLVAE